jgi:hypothetical protein
MSFLISLILGIFLTISVAAPVQAQQTTMSIPAAPSSVTFTGPSAGNVSRSEISFDVSTLPPAAEITLCSFKFDQSGLSSGTLGIVNKANADLLDTKSLNIGGTLSSENLLSLANLWHTQPSSNQGLILQASGLNSSDSVTTGNLRLEISYKISDTEKPQILNLIVNEVTSGSATINWESSEPVTATAKLGKTSNYDTQLTGPALPDIAGSMALAALNPGTTYHLLLTVTDTAGNQTVSADQTFVTSIKGNKILGENTVDPSVLAPAHLNSLEINRNSPTHEVNINWSASKTESIDGYIILRSTDGFNNYQEIHRSDSRTFSFSDPTIGTGHTYVYTIRAFKGLQNSINSEELSIQVPQTIDTDIKVTNQQNPVSNTVIILLAVSGATLFIIYIVARKIVGSMSKGKKKQKLHNVLRDPDYYFNGEGD